MGIEETGKRRDEPEPTGGSPILLELKSSVATTGQPAALRVFSHGVELRRVRSLLSEETQYMAYDQVAQVAVRRGLFRSTLIIESRGGTLPPIVMKGMPKDAVDEAAALIREQLYRASPG